jgi:hypothetical protein
MTTGLTERDYKLLRLLAISSVVNMKQAQLIYGTGQYHYRRVAKLVEDDFLARSGPYIELTQTSAELLDINKPRFKNQETKSWYLPIADLCLKLKEIPVLSNKEIRERYSLNRKTYFRCALEIDSEPYVVYFLHSGTTKQYITHIQKELNIFAGSHKINNAIVFAYNREVRRMFDVDSSGQDHLYLLPYPMGIDMLNQYFTPEHQSRMEAIIGDAHPTGYPFADYEGASGFIADLQFNNITRRLGLTSYYIAKSKPEPITIICLDSQRQLFASCFPKATLQSFPDRLLYGVKKAV